jgi:hypothetical protein
MTQLYHSFAHSSITNKRTTERTIEVLWNVGGRRYGDPMNVPTAEELARSQADLNEYLAYIIMGESFNELRYVELALEALANHNLAAGFEAEFAGKKPPDDLGGRQRRARAAVNAVHSMDIMSRWDAGRARLSAKQLQRRAPDDAAPLSAAAGGALIYLITHAKLAAAKVGIADMSGSRLVQHRRNGWQILAVFQVSAKSAAAIETHVLKWWRGALGLPSYLTRNHMPQGGWTETVAASRLDLAATVTRICNLAVASPPPAPASPGRGSPL